MEFTYQYGMCQLQIHQFNPIRPLEFSIDLYTVKTGRFIVYIQGSLVIISQRYSIFSLKIIFILANSADPDEMPHFIWVLTVCQSTRLGVSGPQRVKFAR